MLIDGVSALASKRRIELSESGPESTPEILPADLIVLEIAGQDLPASALLDGRPLPIIKDSGGRRGHAIVDLFRSVGFHRFEIGAHVYLFGSDDAKLQMAGALQMIRFLGTATLNWDRQVFFADGEVLRDATIDFAWVTTAAPLMIKLAGEISQRPFRRLRKTTALERPGPYRVRVADTIRLLRSNHHFLDGSAAGPLKVGMQQFAPRLVVVEKPCDTYDTMGNRRVVWLLNEMVALVRSLYSSVPRQRRNELIDLQRRCNEALLLRPFAQLRIPRHVADSPAPEELADGRYQQVFEIFKQLSTDLRWHPGLRVAPRFAYVKYIDEIYQAFVAVNIAQVFGMSQVRPLRSEDPAPIFESNQYELYYDTVPPVARFRNWRDDSSRPSDMRPDVTLVEKFSNRGLLLDAKYRVDTGRDRPPTSALNEVQTYMQSFGHSAIAVCYPGKELRTNEVSGGRNCILEVPIRPDPLLQNYLAREGRPALERLLQPLL